VEPARAASEGSCTSKFKSFDCRLTKDNCSPGYFPWWGFTLLGCDCDCRTCPDYRRPRWGNRVNFVCGGEPRCTAGENRSCITYDCWEYKGERYAYSYTEVGFFCEGKDRPPCDDSRCPSCVTRAECDDHDPCTSNECKHDVCVNTPIEGCRTCTTPAECDDNDPCTTDECNGGICANRAVEGCRTCTAPADCDDADACTANQCDGGVCMNPTIDGCVPCTTVADCDDKDACTSDSCTNGTCSHQPIPNCPMANCTDGADNDDDGQIDCTDSDCANDPACTTEICGNCVDDDGDGLVDYEDGDCCDSTSHLVLRKISLHTKPGVAQNKLRIKARYARQAPAGFDPRLQGTTLLLADNEGNFLCQDIPFKSDPAWAAMGVFKFRDKTGLMANGLRNATFRIQRKKNDRLLFGTEGEEMQYRSPSSKVVTVTVRVGTHCTQTTATLKTMKGVKSGSALLFKKP
jgi:hypothetical protein